MLLTRVEQSDWLSNAYLVFDEPGGKGVLVDSNSVTDPLAELAEREGIEITDLLLTHHHYDHVVGARALADRREALVARAQDLGGLAQAALPKRLRLRRSGSRCGCRPAPPSARNPGSPRPASAHGR